MNINELLTMEPMRYWAPPSGLSPQEQRAKIKNRLCSARYITSQKVDGHWSRAVISPIVSALQTRGISKKTGTYGEVQDRVFWWDNVTKAFSNTTVLLGEIYLPGGIDKNVGSALRSKPEKSKCIQSRDYYNNVRANKRLSAKDIRDIEDNEFFNKPLHWYIFDVLVYEGEDLMGKGIEERCQYIDKAVTAINHPFVHGAKYYDVSSDNVFSYASEIWAHGGEGLVLYQTGIPYVAGARGPSAWNTIKVKQSLTEEADVFVTGYEPAIRNYTGTDVTHWPYWIDITTNEKLCGDYYTDYRDCRRTLEPITKGFYYNYPGALICSVYDNNHKFYEICRVAGLTDEWKADIRDHFKENWYLRPLKISAMMVSKGKDNLSYSLRHPVIKSFRDDDININDCTLEKIIQAEA